MTRCIHCTRCVRFADEIAGIPSIGMFGRGLNSEIGTYVKKTFQSELSGNVIDLCPVGALTSKPYPFVNRSWELKQATSIDYCDALGADLQIYIKNNKVIKIQPSYDQTNNTPSWISDKTRFSFDGMFSSNRILNGFILNNNKQNMISTNWSTIFIEIIDTLYFHDQLSRHFFKTNKLLFIFDDTINIETLTLLTLLTKKFSFISLRKSENSKKNVDLPGFLSLKITKNNIQNSEFCLLIGVNPRYESSNLNTLLRQRYLKGNFEVTSVGSFFNLTFPVNYEGHTEHSLQTIVEGTHPLCQKLLHLKNPVIIVNSNFITKKNNNLIVNWFEFLENKLNNYSRNCSINSLNLSNTTNYESTSTYLTAENKFKTQIKFLPSPKQTKEDWQIIRKLFKHTKQINFTNNFNDNNLISFNNITLTKYKSFLYLMYLSGTKLTNNNNITLLKTTKKNDFLIPSNLKNKKNKTYTAKIKLWLHDFYIGGKDSHSRFSVTMIKCSKLLRSETTNFNFTA